MAANRPQLLPSNPWPLAAALTVFSAGIMAVLLGQWRWGAITMAVALLLATALRMILPRHIAGLLVLRRRILDLIVMGGLGAAILIFALVVPSGT